MRRYRLYQVDAFTQEKFKGNPAGVVTRAAGLTDREMQHIARELNNSETAFIFPPDAPDHDVSVRFFTPKVEVPSCGHATIAAHYARALEQGLYNCMVVQKTGAGLFPVEIQRYHDNHRITMTQGSVSFSEPFNSETEGEILSAIGLPPSQRDARCPMQIVSTGHSKVLIGIRERRVLNSLQPDLERLTELSRVIDCNGYFVFTFDSDVQGILTQGRMFAPAIGISEDPVTGNAHGPLGAYILQHQLVQYTYGSLSFRGLQGEAMGRPGVVDVEVKIEDKQPMSVKVGGQAALVFQTEIRI